MKSVDDLNSPPIPPGHGGSLLIPWSEETADAGPVCWLPFGREALHGKRDNSIMTVPYSVSVPHLGVSDVL